MTTTRLFFEQLADVTWSNISDIPNLTFALLWDLIPDDEIIGSVSLDDF